MRRLLLFAGLCCYGALLLAQSVPRFQMPLYFEDAVGNRDTIVVGYDAMGSYDTLNPQFGEYAITTPFDSTFEVRVAHALHSTPMLSKKIIAHYEGGGGDTCFASAGVEIFMQAKYLPVTVRFDTSLVNSSYCHRNMLLSPDWFIFLMQYWWDAREYYCMSHTDMVVDTFTHPGAMYPGDSWLTRPLEVKGQGIKELPGYFWIVKYIGICQYQVGTEVPAVPVTGMALSPNPASGLLRIDWPLPFCGRVEVFNLAGNRMLFHQAVQESTSIEIEVSQLPAGLYFLSALSTNGQRSVRPLAVMR